jgi:hypothetical protein
MKTPVLLTLQMLAFAEVAAQTPSKWCEYVPRSTKDILEHAHLGDSADVDFSGGQFPSRVTLRYTGNTRSLSSERHRFLRDYSRVIGIVGLDTLFRHEVEFAPAADTSYWFPIQEATLKELQSELAPGDTSTLFLLWGGSYHRPSGPRGYVFLINEFTSRRSADEWKASLATCGH